MLSSLRSRSLLLLLRTIVCLSIIPKRLQALNTGVTWSAAAGGTDTTATLAISSSAFARLVRSETFYRNTRQNSGNVQQKVVELSNWVASGTTDGVKKPAAPPTNEARIALLKPLLPPPPPPPPPPPQQLRREELQREARLLYVISSPVLGSSDAKVVQQHALEIDRDGGTVRYCQADCITGFPMLRGDLSVETTIAVTPAEGDPGSITVRVGVTVGDLPLPRSLRWLKARVEKIMRADATKQAKVWLEEMAATEERGETTTS